MRTFRDDTGAVWEVTVGKASYGSLMLLFSLRGAYDVRTSLLTADTQLQAEAALQGLDEPDLKARLAAAEPWG